MTNRKQRIVIPGVVSNWAFIKASDLQGYILGHLLFILYINDIVVDRHVSVMLFSKEISLYVIVDNPNETARNVNAGLEIIQRWA